MRDIGARQVLDGRLEGREAGDDLRHGCQLALYGINGTAHDIASECAHDFDNILTG